MPTIEKVIELLSCLRSLTPACDKKIQDAEKSLGLRFAEDYRAYVRKYGAISARGIELTGVTDSPRLNVVDVTLRERRLNAALPSDMYVIENVAIDGILMLQNTEGAIFEIRPGTPPEKRFDSLGSYLVSKE